MIIFTFLQANLFQTLRSIVQVERLYLASCGGSKSSPHAEGLLLINDNSLFSKLMFNNVLSLTVKDSSLYELLLLVQSRFLFRESVGSTRRSTRSGCADDRVFRNQSKESQKEFIFARLTSLKKISYKRMTTYNGMWLCQEFRPSPPHVYA